ncbi:hypothetical protein L1887_12160 [Cichorium endivia]|nr:hypothetical protein L1887_12160 [Cichorium endivia]
MEKQANEGTLILQLPLILSILKFEVVVRCSLEELSFRLSHHRSNPGDMRDLLVLKLLLLLCSCCIVLFFKVATISSNIHLMLTPQSFKLERYAFTN